MTLTTRSRRWLRPLALALIAFTVTVMPALAANTDSDQLNVTITTGALDIFGGGDVTFDSVPLQYFGTPLAETEAYTYTVADNTGNTTTGWIVSVTGAALSDGGSATIPVGSITLASTSVTSLLGDPNTGVTPTSSLTLTGGAQQLLEAIGSDGDGAYAHLLNITVTVPNGTQPATYGGTLTLTVVAGT